MDCSLLSLLLLTSFAVVCCETCDKDEDKCLDVGIWLLPFPDDICKPARCPEPFSEEWRRLQLFCCLPDKPFHCQQNNKGQIEVVCSPPGSCPLGQFASIESLCQLKVLCQTCPLSEYQPTAKNYSAFVRPSCDKKRIRCEDFDAVLLATGNSSTDDTCMCDWLHGYRPVSKTDYHCRTFNSSHASICRCKFRHCQKGERLHPKKGEDYYQWLREYAEQLRHRYDGKIEILNDLQDDFALQKVFSSQSHDPLPIFQESPPVPQKAFPHAVQEPSQPPVSEGLQYDSVVLGAGVTSGLLLIPLVICFILRRWSLRRRGKLYSFFKRQIHGETRPFGSGGSKTRDHLIRISFTSQKTADMVSKEVKNILPLLARRHGQLHLVSSPSCRHLTMVIHPKEGRPIHLAQFFKDAFSPVAVKQAMAKGTDNEANICIWSGCFQDLKRAHFNLKHPVNSTTVSCNAGEISLKSSKIDEEVLKKLRSPACKASLSNIFSKHHLKLDGIRSGSIIFTFHLPNGSTTFDAYATDQRMKEFAEELASHEAIQSLAKEVPMKLEFFCKAKLENASVVYAENLTVQVGMLNKVYICDKDPASHCDHPQAVSADDDALVTSADELQATVGEMLKFNSVRIHGTATGARLGVKDTWVDRDREPGDAFIKVHCRTSAMVVSLHTQWANILPLLKQYHPGCLMRPTKDTCIAWRLRACGEELPDTAAFLKDIFGIDTVKYLVLENPPRVEVFVPPQRNEVRQSAWQKIRQSLKANATKGKAVLLILAFVMVELNFCGFGTGCFGFNFCARLAVASFVCTMISRRH